MLSLSLRNLWIIKLFKLLSLMKKWCCYFFIISLVYVLMLYLMIFTHNENKSFTVTMIYNHIFQNKYESNGKKHKASAEDKKVTSYAIVQLGTKSFLCFLNMFIPILFCTLFCVTILFRTISFVAILFCTTCLVLFVFTIDIRVS